MDVYSIYLLFIFNQLSLKYIVYNACSYSVWLIYCRSHSVNLLGAFNSHYTGIENHVIVQTGQLSIFIKSKVLQLIACIMTTFYEIVQAFLCFYIKFMHSVNIPASNGIEMVCTFRVIQCHSGGAWEWPHFLRVSPPLFFLDFIFLTPKMWQSVLKLILGAHLLC